MEKRKVLFVDDESDARNLVQMNVEAYDVDFTVDTSEDAKTAINLINENKYDGVIIDLILPDMGGVMLAGLIRKVHPDMPIAFLTAYQSETAKEWAGGIQAEFWTKAEKLSDFEKLASCIQELIKGKTCEGEELVPAASSSDGKIELPQVLTEIMTENAVELATDVIPKEEVATDGSTKTG